MKAISDKAIERPRLVILASALACAIGFMAVLDLPKERTPRVKLPVVIVAVPNPGAAPPANERQIIRPIEEAADELDGLRDEGGVISQAVNGAAIVQFIFDDGVDVVEAKRDVESLINRVKAEFPREAQSDPGPQVSDIAFEDFPVIQVVVAGGTNPLHRRDIAEELQSRIEGVPGISAVDLFGGAKREVQIEVDPHRMALLGFSYEAVAAAIRSANAELPTGEVSGGGGTDSRVRAETTLDSVEEIARVPLGEHNGRPILLQDIASVRMGTKERTSIARYGGEDAVVLLARAKTDVDVLAAADAIQAIVDDFVARGGSQGTHIGTVRSQAREIRYMMSQLGWSAVYGTALVILILWIAMGWRNALIISVVLPFSILFTAALMWTAKHLFYDDIAINNMTLFAMILVVGMVVDGCIVAGENIFRHRELGRSPVNSAKLGIGEVGASLIASSLTTIAAFGPMYLVRGIMGDFLSLLPTTVIFALCGAMLVDHFLLPVLSMYLMKVRRRGVQATPAEIVRRRALSPEEAELESIETTVRSSRFKRAYGNTLHYALHHRLLVMSLATVVSLSPAVLFWMGAIKFEFFPEGDIPIVEVYFELPLGESMETRTVAVAEKVEAAVLRAVRPEEWYRAGPHSPRMQPVTTIGETGALNIRLDDQAGQGPEFGMVYVELQLAENRQRTAEEIRRAIEEAIPPMPGVEVRAKRITEGPPTGAPVNVRVLASDEDTPLEVLAQRADRVEQILASLPGTYDVASDFRLRPEISVEPDAEVAVVRGLTREEIARAVNFALDGVRVSDVDFGGDEQIDIRLRNRPEDRDDLTDLANLPIRTMAGQVRTLDEVAEVDRRAAPNVIRHYDRRRVIDVRAQLHDGVIPDDIKARLIAELRPELDAGERRALVNRTDDATLYADGDVRIEFGGENDIRNDALEDLNIALLVGAGAMLVILTVNFNSFVQPLIILFSVPLSLVGVSLGLMVCGFNFSISAMIGVVALAGIVVNDAIVLVDFYNRLRNAGLAPEASAVASGQLRLRPIFLTTITTVGGLLPLALNLSGGGEFWQPLTISIMGGLLFATLLQMYIIPLACYSFDSARKVSIFDPDRHPTLSKAAVADHMAQPAMG